MDMYVVFEKKCLPIVEKTMPLFDEAIFSTWNIKPKFSIEKIDDEEFQFHVSYENSDMNGLAETKARHDALDLALTFISGYTCAMEEKNVVPKIGIHADNQQYSR